MATATTAPFARPRIWAARSATTAILVSSARAATSRTGPPPILRPHHRRPNSQRARRRPQLFLGTPLLLRGSDARQSVRLAASPGLGENAKIDLRANFYNIFNQTNFVPFTNSEQTIRTINVNEITGTRTVTSPNGAFGQGLTALAGRVIELQARFSF